MEMVRTIRVVAAVIGVPLLRLRGHYLAFATLGPLVMTAAIASNGTWRARVDARTGEVLEFLGEVSHPAHQRERCEALVVAQRGTDDIRGEVGQDREVVSARSAIVSSHCAPSAIGSSLSADRVTARKLRRWLPTLPRARCRHRIGPTWKVVGFLGQMRLDEFT